MPSRDYEAPHEDPRPEGRWGGDPARDAPWREAERRHGRSQAFESRERHPDDEPDPHGPGESDSTFTQHADSAGRGSAFTAAPREARGPAGPGSSYGGGGRASGSQAYGHEPPQPPGRERGAPSAWGQPPQERRRAESPPLRARPASPQGRDIAAERPQRHGWDRQDDTQFDADYRQWRDEQMRMLDREYAQWRQERYRKFAEEFSQWRSQRWQGLAASQRQDPPAVPSLDEASALGPATGGGPPQGGPREHCEAERPGGGLLGSLLGGQGERHHKPKP